MTTKYKNEGLMKVLVILGALVGLITLILWLASMENYGFVPQFKAGLHLGIVTAVEVGEIKRDIAYHGDTLNTAARIQSICNQYDKIFLVSGDAVDFIKMEDNYHVESLGDITLKGKNEPIGVYSIESKNINKE